MVWPENGKLEFGLAKERKSGKGKLRFSDKSSRLQKMSVLKESYQLAGVCTERGRGLPLSETQNEHPRNVFASTPKRFYP